MLSTISKKLRAERSGATEEDVCFALCRRSGAEYVGFRGKTPLGRDGDSAVEQLCGRDELKEEKLVVNICSITAC